MDQSVEAISRFDVVWSRRGHEPQSWSLRIGRRQVERAMRPVAVVMVDVSVESRAFVRAAVADAR